MKSKLLLIALLAAWVSEWAAASLYFCERLIFLPLGVFATALGTVLLPAFSGQAARGDRAAIARTAVESLRLLLFVMMPAAAGLAVLASLIIGFWYREVDFKRLRSAMLDGGMQTAVVMLLVASSVVMGGFLTRAQLPQELAQGILEITSNKWMILLILNFFFLIIGFLLHSAAAIILVVPIVVPLIVQAGIDPVHFGLVVTLNLAIGQQTPPVASVLITACSIARANIWDVTRVNIWFIAVLLTVLLMCTYIPAIPMFLVEYFYRS